jgi:hypothetical protein
MSTRTLTVGWGTPNNKRLVMLCGTFTIGSSGAVSSSTADSKSGGTVTQTGSEDGRYGVAFYKTVKTVQAFGCGMNGPDDSAFPTTTGSDPQCRLVTTTGMSVQFKRTDTQADADPASGTIGSWWALCEV